MRRARGHLRRLDHRVHPPARAARRPGAADRSARSRPTRRSQRLRERLGLNDPLSTFSTGTTCSDFVTGDWGFSYSAGQQRHDADRDRLPATHRARALRVRRSRSSPRVAARAARRRTGGARSSTASSAASRSSASGRRRSGSASSSCFVFSEWLGVLPGPEGRLDAGHRAAARGHAASTRSTRSSRASSGTSLGRVRAPGPARVRARLSRRSPSSSACCARTCSRSRASRSSSSSAARA